MIENEFGEVGVDEALVKNKFNSEEVRRREAREGAGGVDICRHRVRLVCRIRRADLPPRCRVPQEIFEMNNGCVCCTVRGDLINILIKLCAAAISPRRAASPHPTVRSMSAACRHRTRRLER